MIFPTEYGHIDTIWKRDMSDGPNKGIIIPGEFANDELQYLSTNEWVGTEKVDGTNIRIELSPRIMMINGKTDAAIIPPKLQAKFAEMFLGDAGRTGAIVAQFHDAWAREDQVVLYCEGFGAGIQKGGGNYDPAGVRFCLFDVRVGEWWLKRPAVEQIADNLRLEVAPVIFRGSLWDAHIQTSMGFTSQWGNFTAEGMVMTPSIPLLKRNGDRILTKIKYKDYADLRVRTERRDREALGAQ